MAGVTGLPTGTIAFVFTDVEESTPLAVALGEDAWSALLAEHDRAIRSAFEGKNGHIVATTGDGFFAVFDDTADAIAATVAAQQALVAVRGPAGATLRVRMGVHVGSARLVGDNYVGAPVHEAARVADAAHGGQIVVSRVASEIARGSSASDITFRDLGEFVLKGITGPRGISQVLHPTLRSEFPPLRTGAGVESNLPKQLTAFVGRRRELEEVVNHLDAARLVTLVGPGGVGKTRLAVEAATLSMARFPGGVWFCDLAPLTEESEVGGALARAVDGRADFEGLIDLLASRRALIVVDNCEHVIGGATSAIEKLVTSCEPLRVIATSRKPLSMRGEFIHPVEPLSTADLNADGCSLFVERARAHGYELEPDDEGVIVSICRALDGLPLAIELAAAQARMFSPTEIEDRLGSRLGFSSTTVRGDGDRQATIRSTIDWGYELLSPEERLLLMRLAVFVGGFEIEAVERVCTDERIAEQQALPLLTALVDRSFVRRGRRGARTRFYLLETIREYADERLNAPLREKATFVRDGAVWKLTHGPDIVQLKDGKGTRYLAELLRRPGESMAAVDLLVAVDPRAREPVAAERGGDAILDEASIEAYRGRLAEIASDLDEARAWNDLARAERLEEEARAIDDELLRSLGLGGRSRETSHAAERARLSVRKAVLSAISHVEIQAPDLGEHLRGSISTGLHCAYDPREPVTWEVRP